MKSLVSIGSTLFLFLAILLLPGCAAIAGIFKAGIWTGIILVGLIVLLVIFFFNRGGKNN